MKIYNVIHLVGDSLNEIKSFDCADTAVYYAANTAEKNRCEHQSGWFWTAKGQSVEVIETTLTKERK